MDKATFEARYRGIEIIVEEENPDEEGYIWSGHIYLGCGEWHEFEGSGLFGSAEDLLEYMKTIVDRDFPIVPSKQDLDSHDYQRIGPEDVDRYKHPHISGFEIEA